MTAAFHGAPGPADTAHLWGSPDDDDYAFGDYEDWYPPRRAKPALAHFKLDGHCRFGTRRAYRTRADARQGARDIQAQVEYRGGTYTTLHAFKCPEGDHWHLSRYSQGKKRCGVCKDLHEAWNGGEFWIMAAHENRKGLRCFGEGQPAYRGRP